ncbi:ABC transporter substrate-binding protein [Streptomyces virginiae]|uniref:ABC transporter substrate-binding protein n=1 Tax=Streptomyces virginiae TaxID=1961 RepID=UPI003570CE7E
MDLSSAARRPNGTSTEGCARERKNRATPFFAHPHHRDHHGSTDPHRLRIARRRLQGQQRRQEDRRRHRRRRPADRFPLRSRSGHQELRGPRGQTANKNNEVPGIEFKVEALDDQAVPASGQANATKLVGNKDVLGVVGPLNSGVAQQMQGVFASAKLAQVSPANTNPRSARVTTGARASSSAASTPTSAPPPPTWSRASSPPSTSSRTPARRRSSSSTTSRPTAPASAAIFAEEFKKLGGEVAGTDHVTVKETDFSSHRRQGQVLRRRLRLLRRPVPRGRPARRPDQEGRRRRPAHGRRRHPGPRLHQRLR